MGALPAVLIALAVSWTASGQGYTISTLAGGGPPVGVAGTSATLSAPMGLAVDKAGNVFFTNGNAVLRLDATTGVLTLAAGNASPGFSGDNGPATSARLNAPSGLAVDSAGNLYIADTGNNRVREVSNGVIATVAGNGALGYSGDSGPATNAQLNSPSAAAPDSAGNLYIADAGNNVVRKITGGVIATVAGNGTQGYRGDNGPAASAWLNQPQGVAVDSAGNLYIADTYNHQVRIVSNGTIATVAGNGAPGAVNGWYLPMGLAVDSAGSLYVADIGCGCVYKLSSGAATTVAGGEPSVNDVPPANAFLEPWAVAVDSAGNPYFTDVAYNLVRKIVNGTMTTVAGGGVLVGDNGPAASAQVYYPQGLAVDSAGNVYIADTWDNRVRKISPNGTITSVAGSGTEGYSGDNGPAIGAELSLPAGVAVDQAGSVYIADFGNNRIRKVANGTITTVAGNGTAGYSGDNGPATSAELYAPSGVALDSAGNLYIADTYNDRIRKVSNGVIATVAGGGISPAASGPATSAGLHMPAGVAVDSAGDLYIADSYNNLIRKVSNGAITTVAGGGPSLGDNGPATSASLNQPEAVAVDSTGNLYIADRYDSRIRKVSNGVITTVAGGGTSMGTGFSGNCATLSNPSGVAVDSAGNVYAADSGHDLVRLLTPSALPGICPGGVVPVDSPIPTIQSGSWVSIYGGNLAAGIASWNYDFPTSLGGTSVTIDGKLAYLLYVSPTQIDLQAPDDTATGPVSVVVSTAAGSAASTVTLAAYGPSFSLLGDGKHVAGAIPTPSGSGAYGGGAYDLVGPSNTFPYNTRPVKAGETLVLFGLGFGPTAPHVPAGQAFSGAAPTSSAVTITIGGVPASVAFSGIAEAGLYQFNLAVPPGTGSGDQALMATVGGVQTPAGPVVTVQ